MKLLEINFDLFHNNFIRLSERTYLHSTYVVGPPENVRIIYIYIAYIEYYRIKQKYING